MSLPVWAGLTRRAALVGVLTLFVALFPFWPAFDATGMNMDEGMLLLYPERLMKGDLPYRDFETFYGPANIYALAGAYSIFGVNVGVERTVGLIYRALLLGGIFVFVRRWGSTVAVFSTIIGSLFLSAAQLFAFAWLGGVACAVWALLCLSGKPQPWRAGAAGLLAAAALLYRPDLGLAVIASALPLFLRLPSRQRWFYLGGGAIGLLPLLLLTLAAGAGSIVENLFLYPVVLTNPGRRLPLSDAGDDLVFMFSLHLGASICALVTGFLLCRGNRQSPDARLFLSFALLAIGLTHQGMQRADVTHLVMTAFLSIGLLPVALVLLARRGRMEVPPVGWSLAAGVAVVVVLAISETDLCALHLQKHLPHYNADAPKTPIVTVRDRQFPARGLSRQAQTVVSFIERQAVPGERLFVGTGDLRLSYANDTYIYHLLPWLPPATYFLEMNPLSANRPNSRLASDVASADWLVLNHAWNHSHEPNLSTQPGSDAPNEVVRTKFELRGRTWPFEVYHRKRVIADAPVVAN